jgi:hypothetical protein
MIHVRNCISLWLVGFEDTMFIGILGPLAIAVAVIFALFIIGDGVFVMFETNLIDNFEIFWLMGPIMFFVAIGVTSRRLTYELLSND